MWDHLLVLPTLSIGGLHRTQRINKDVDFISRCWVIWECSIVISMAFNSVSMEPHFLVILACRGMDPDTQIMSLVQTEATQLVQFLGKLTRP